MWQRKLAQLKMTLFFGRSANRLYTRAPSVFCSAKSNSLPEGGSSYAEKKFNFIFPWFCVAIVTTTAHGDRAQWAIAACGAYETSSDVYTGAAAQIMVAPLIRRRKTFTAQHIKRKHFDSSSFRG